MLAILTSHPIQYQAPLWRALAAADTGPMKVWFLSDHGLRDSPDAEFGKTFAWDVDLLSGYPHEFLPVEVGSNLRSFRGVKLSVDPEELLKRDNVTDLWVEGWRLQPMWELVRAAKRLGVRVWMRGESNDLKHDASWKRLVKRVVLGRHLAKVDHFLCIGSANRRLYRNYGAAEHQLESAPYSVDNDRFAALAEHLRPLRSDIRNAWNVPDDALCVLFCGKFIDKKRPMDVVVAADKLMWGHKRKVHLLFVGSGELGSDLRASCQVTFDAEGATLTGRGKALQPTASFVGFLNQSEIAKAYVAADVLALPSMWDETWGLVVNEAMASGCPAIVSDQCGCAEDLPAKLDPALVYSCGDVPALARALAHASASHYPHAEVARIADTHHLRHTVAAVQQLRPIPTCA
jgi:glycosyltransferase involved in cell wall biosynthesis